MAKLQIDISGIAGLAPRHYGDKPLSSSNPQHRYIGSQGQIAEGVCNPISMLGFMSPASNTVTTVTGTTDYLITSKMGYPPGMSGVISNAALYFADEATGATDQGVVLELETNTDTAMTTVYTVPTSGSPSQYYHIEDMVPYMLDGLTEWFMLKTNNGGTGTFDDLIRSPDLVWSSVDDTYFSSLDGDSISIWARDRYKLLVASDKFMYIMDGAAVHRIDGDKSGGANGIASENVLVFIGSNESSISHQTSIQDAIDYRNRIWFGLHVQDYKNSIADFSNFEIDQDFSFNNLVGVYVWNRKTAVASMDDFIWIHGVKRLVAMCEFQGRPACWTLSYDNYTEFRVFNGSEFQVVARMGKNGYPPYRNHSYETVGDIVYWIGNDGYVYAYGRVEPGLSNALYIIGDMTQHVSDGETFTRSGVLAMMNGSETVTSGYNDVNLAFYISFEDSGGNHMVKFYPHGYDPASTDRKAYTGEVKTLVQLLPKLSNMKGVTVFFPAKGSGGSTELLDVKIYSNMSSTADKTETLTQNDLEKGFAYIPFGKPNVNAIQLGLAWKGENLADNITPYLAEIDYEPIIRLK